MGADRHAPGTPARTAHPAHWFVILVAGILLVLGSGGPVRAATAPEQSGRIGNWFYISGTDGLFGVPRFVGAVHDTTARSSLVFACQRRPGLAERRDVPPMMSLKLTEAVGSPGERAKVRMRLDESSAFETTWNTGAADESTLADGARPDPLQILSRIGGKRHRKLQLETDTSTLEFELDGASAVLGQALDACTLRAVKPAAKKAARSSKVKTKRAASRSAKQSKPRPAKIRAQRPSR